MPGRKPTPETKQRKVFDLLAQGRSRNEIARATGLPTGTVATLIHRHNLAEREARKLQPAGTG